MREPGRAQYSSGGGPPAWPRWPAGPCERKHAPNSPSRSLLPTRQNFSLSETETDWIYFLKACVCIKRVQIWFSPSSAFFSVHKYDQIKRPIQIKWYICVFKVNKQCFKLIVGKGTCFLLTHTSLCHTGSSGWETRPPGVRPCTPAERHVNPLWWWSELGRSQTQSPVWKPQTNIDSNTLLFQ